MIDDEDMHRIPAEFWEMPREDFMAIVDRGGYLNAKDCKRLWRMLGKNPKHAPKQIGPLYVSEETTH